MQTSYLQSMLCRNAAAITLLTAMMRDQKDHAYTAQLQLSRNKHRTEVHKLRNKIIKLAAVQKAIKFDLHAAKYARLQQVRRTKHGKDDRRYLVWLGLRAAQAPLDLL